MDAAINLKVQAVVALYADPGSTGIDAMYDSIEDAFGRLLDNIIELGHAHDAELYPRAGNEVK